MTTLHCNSRLRRERVRRQQALNGLDYLEVGLDEAGETTLASQRRLRVFFLGKAAVELTPANIRIEGGRRIRDLRATDVSIHRFESADFDDYIDVVVDKAGDHSTYTLRVVEQDERHRLRPHSAFDPRYDRIEFSFKIDCPSDLDCLAEASCPPEPVSEPDINYLAKDYASFRQLLLDRLALLLPEWKERHVPDIGITLVEILAYTADQLSYYQDAVATEAYLNTARRRISVRRHARLVDYALHEGCNARAWVCVETDATLPAMPLGEIYFTTRLNDLLPSAPALVDENQLATLQASQYDVFEPVIVAGRPETVRFYKHHSKIRFYTWGEQECCLPRGATAATLIGKWRAPDPDEADSECDDDEAQEMPENVPAAAVTITNASRTPRLRLLPGDVLILIEVKGPKTTRESEAEQALDADPLHRHAVRLTRVEGDVDPLTGQQIVHVEWAEEDALPFPLCISSLGAAPDCRLIEDVSIACANVVLVDHGRTAEQDLGRVPKRNEAQCCIDVERATDAALIAGRFEPMLAGGPLTFSAPADAATPARLALYQDVRSALPRISLAAIPPGEGGDEPLFTWSDLNEVLALANRLQAPSGGSDEMLASRLSAKTRNLLQERTCPTDLSDALKTALTEDLQALLQAWSPQPDLLASNADERHFVVETDDERIAHLRFGEHGLGRKPDAGTSFRARYRIGNGPVGNVGTGVIEHLVWRKHTLDAGNVKISNPLPAQGGSEAEAVAEAKLYAPGAFRHVLHRAVIAQDYADLTVRDFKSKVQNAAARLRWNGSWHEVLTAVDALGKESADDALLQQIAERLHRFRRIGHDLTVGNAERVALDVALGVCVLPNYLRGHVKAELQRIFSNKRLPNGKLGLFHPDALSFGDDVYLSRLVAAAQAVEGVESVEVTKFQRLNELPNDEIENGVLPLGAFEIARLDNDPGFPDNGRFTLDIRGGR